MTLKRKAPTARLRAELVELLHRGWTPETLAAYVADKGIPWAQREAERQAEEEAARRVRSKELGEQIRRQLRARCDPLGWAATKWNAAQLAQEIRARRAVLQANHPDRNPQPDGDAYQRAVAELDVIRAAIGRTH